MVEALTLHHLPSTKGNIFGKCNNLESLHKQGLTVPATMRRLRFVSLLLFKRSTIKFDDERHLDYIECGVIPRSCKQVGPYVWCRREIREN